MSNYDLLKNIGFSKLAARCYQALDELDYANAEQLAKHLGRPKTGQYRVLKQLEEWGFVDAVKTSQQPTYFYAIALYDAWPAFTGHQKFMVKPLVDEQEARRNKIRRAAGLF